MGALGESIQARGLSWMHSGWSREAWKGAEWSSQSSWGWFTLKSPHGSATFPWQAAGTGPQPFTRAALSGGMSPFYEWRNPGSECSRCLSNATQLVSHSVGCRHGSLASRTELHGSWRTGTRGAEGARRGLGMCGSVGWAEQ